MLGYSTLLPSLYCRLVNLNSSKYTSSINFIIISSFSLLAGVGHLYNVKYEKIHSKIIEENPKLKNSIFWD